MVLTVEGREVSHVVGAAVVGRHDEELRLFLSLVSDVEERLAESLGKHVCSLRVLLRLI